MATTTELPPLEVGTQPEPVQTKSPPKSPERMVTPRQVDPGALPSIPSPSRRLSGRSNRSSLGDVMERQRTGLGRPFTSGQSIDYRKVVDRLATTHTRSSQAKKNVPFLYDTYMDAGCLSWHKMALFQDCHTHLWGKDGGVKKSYMLKT